MNAKSRDRIVYERVLEATRELLGTRGVKGWNMDALSGKAGLSKRTLYKIIGTRENIVGEVLVAYIQGIQTELAGIIGREKDYIKAMYAVLDLYPDMLNTDFIEIFPDVFREYPGIERKILAHQDAFTQKIIEFIAKGMDQGFLEKSMPPEEVFDVFRGLVHYYTTTSRNRQDMAARLKKAFHLVLQGLRRPDAD